MNTSKRTIGYGLTAILALFFIAAGCGQKTSAIPSSAESNSALVEGKVHVGYLPGQEPQQVNTTSSPPEVFSTSTEAYFLSGPITKKEDGSSITVRLQDGSQKDAIIDSSTVIEKFDSKTMKMNAMTMSDLNIGDLILVSVKVASDGTTKATRIREGVMLPN